MFVYVLILSSSINKVSSFPEKDGTSINAVVRNTFTVACFILAVESFMFTVSSFINQEASFITAVRRNTFAIAYLTNADACFIK